MKRIFLLLLCLPLAAMQQSCSGCSSDDDYPARRPEGAGAAQQTAPPAEDEPDSRTTAASRPEESDGAGEPTVVRMTREGGVYKVPVRINGTEMDFIFDTGASLISISNLEASYLIKQGKISREDVQGSSKFVDALGNVSEGTIVNLKQVSIGGHTVYNIKASVVDNDEAPLLLGQTFLEQFGRIAIDYKAGTLTFY